LNCQTHENTATSAETEQRQEQQPGTRMHEVLRASHRGRRCPASRSRERSTAGKRCFASRYAHRHGTPPPPLEKRKSAGNLCEVDRALEGDLVRATLLWMTVLGLRYLVRATLLWMTVLGLRCLSNLHQPPRPRYPPLHDCLGLAMPAGSHLKDPESQPCPRSVSRFRRHR